jgi:hypothetical protein
VTSDAWPDPVAFAANAAGQLAPGQREMLIGPRVRPPYPALSILAAVAVGGAALWWRFGFPVGITVLLIGTNVGLAVMSMNLDRRRRRRRLRRNLTHATIAGGVGEIVAPADIRSGVGPIELGLGSPAPPPPGWFYVYWLEHPQAQRWNADRVLLSARPIPEPSVVAGGSNPVVAAEVRARLRQVLRRTEWEIRSNRAGVLSPPQRDQLRRQARGSVWARLAGITVGILVAGLFLASAFIGLRRSTRDDVIAGAIAAVIGLVAFGLTARGLVRLPSLVSAIGHPPALLRASGPVTVKQTDWENNVWSVAVDGGPTFSVGSDVARAFQTPLEYVVYFVRRDFLLAAEPLAFDSSEPPRAWPDPDLGAANALGQLTPAQGRLIMGKPITWRSAFILWPVLVVVGGTAVPYISRSGVVDDGTELVWTVTIACMVVAAWAAWLVWRLVTRARLAALIRRPEILSSVGEIDWYEARTPDWRLPLPSGPLPEPGPYVLYWINAPGPTLLSAVPTTPS